MEVQKDFEELLGLLNSANAEYVIVGGYAVAFHGAPRFTGDIDILIRPSPENAQRVLRALDGFGFSDVGIESRDLTVPNQIIQLGVPPVRVDFVTSISGVLWEEAWEGRIPATYGKAAVSYLGKAELLKNKRASGRKKDLLDLEALDEL